MTRSWFDRYFQYKLDELVLPGKVFILYGPRRVGKTELIKRFIKKFEGKVYQGTGDNMELQQILVSRNLSMFKTVFGAYDLIFIDEAQRIPQIGIALKLLIDHLPNVRIIATGSSSFDLSNALGEPLTGRQKIRTLYPLSILELNEQFGGMDVIHRLEQLMIFGAYPEVLTLESVQEKVEYLMTLRDSYLLKDVLEMESIRNPLKLSELLKLLAYQIGHEVSLNELSNRLGIAKKSVERYLDLLEKSFVIKKVTGFSRNLRNEVTKTARYYFYDNGIRNALISNFNQYRMRNDQGMLWENLLYIERYKSNAYKQIYANSYFWRTYNRKEIDLVEERDGKLFGYEFKLSPKKLKAPGLWTEAYPDASFEVISRDNFLEFLI